MKKKTQGIIFLVLLGLAAVACFANGTFANLGDQNVGYYVGLFGGMAALLYLGLSNLFSKEK